jgi:threonine-phosphate decarboxylase
MLEGHGGDIFGLAARLKCHPTEITDMSSNINPLGTPPGMMDHLVNSMQTITALPEVNSQRVARKMAQCLGIDAQCILAGGGTTQFIYSAPQALEVSSALIVGPTYADYADACRMQGIEPVYYLTRPDGGFAVDLKALAQAARQVDLVFICNPNNPTGTLMTKQEALELAVCCPRTHFLIDESYLPFVSGCQELTLVDNVPANMSVLCSLSKIFGIPGLRAGFVISQPATIHSFGNYQQPWTLNALAQEAIDFLTTHWEKMSDFIVETQSFIQTEHERFQKRLTGCHDVTLYSNQIPYLLIKLPHSCSADSVWDTMSKHRILIRNCSNFHGLNHHFIRVSLKDAPTNARVAEHLTAAIETGN